MVKSARATIEWDKHSIILGEKPTQGLGDSVVWNVLWILEINERQSELELLLMKLKTEVERKISKIWYDYSDYNDRIFSSEEEIKRIFKSILRENATIRELYEKIISITPESQKEVLIKSLYRNIFEDLIYSKVKNYSSDSPVSLSFSNKESFLEEIQFWVDEKWHSYIDLRDNHLWKLLWVEWMLELVEKTWKKTLRALVLTANGLWEYLRTEWLLNFIDKLWENWMKFLDISFNDLWKYLWKDGILKLVERIWKVWINILWLAENELWKYLWKEGIFELIEIAWKNWIKSLDIWYNNIVSYLWYDWIFNFVETAWKNWVKVIELWDNDLSEIRELLGEDWVSKLKELFLVYWIKILDL